MSNTPDPDMDTGGGNGADVPVDGENTKRMPLWLIVLLAPFTLLGLLLRPLEWLLKAIFAPIEWLLPKSWRGEEGLFGSIKTVIYAILIAVIIRTVAYEPFNIPSGSMKPTLLVGDYLFVSKFAYGYSNYSLGFGTNLNLFDGRLFGAEPERGDVVVFRKPTETSIDFIKRLVGLPGDTIQVISGVLHINGEAAPLEPMEPFLDEGCSGITAAVPQFRETLPNGVDHAILDAVPNYRLDDTEAYVVPEGHYFMMGDNRDRSNDSRVLHAVGFVPAENLIGRAEFLFFSVDGCGGLLEPWTWPGSIRWDRLFQSLR
jgi:signal peptidase I